MSAGRTKVLIEATPLISTKMSGVGHVLLETVRALDTAGVNENYKVSLFVPFNERSKLDRYKFKYIQVKTLPYHHKFFSLFARMRWSPPLDLFLGKGVYVFANFRNWPLFYSRSITYIHDVCFAIYPDYVEQRNLNFLQKYTPLWISRTDVLATVSGASEAEIRKYLKVTEKPIEVFPNAIDAQKFFPQSKDVIDAMRKKYMLERDYVLYLGNIEPRKNLTTLVDGFVKSSISGEADLFIIGGDGWKNEAIYERINEAKRNGYRIKKNEHYVPDEDLPGLISGASVLVQPSWHEGFGLAAMQAIACGTPVVCSDIPSLHEVVDDYPTMAQFFDPSSSDELAMALDKPFRAQEQDVLDKKEVTLPSWENTAKKLLKIVDQLNEGGM